MIEFILNQKTIRSHASAGMAMLDFIRKRRQLTGMKLVCKEGECGACSVLVGSFIDGELVYQSMTSCIMPLVNAHGKHILTVEGLAEEEGTLTPVQQAMVDENGTQCGFCTPGFVVSMTGAMLTGRAANQKSILEAIDGNICRCTGYKSIERAVDSLASKLKQAGQPNSLKDLTKAGFLPSYMSTIVPRLRALEERNAKRKGIRDASAVRLGGGTDLYVQRPLKMYESEVQPMFDRPEMKQVKIENGKCIFGASRTMGDLYYSKKFQKALPNTEYLFRLLSSTQIRNMATIGGNLVNASPIGDFTILLLGLNAEITLSSKSSSRNILLRDFYKDYKVMDLKDGEHLESIQFDIPHSKQKFHFEKVSQRRFLDIAGVNSASTIELDQNSKIVEVHLSAGGVGPIPMYLFKTCAFLKGKELSEETIDAACEVLQSEISPISDARGTAEYKRLLLRQLFIAHFIEIDPNIFTIEKLIASC